MEKKKEVNKKKYFVFLFVLILSIFFIFSIYFSVALVNSDSSSLREWLVVGRNLNHTGYYPGSLNMTHFNLLWLSNESGTEASSAISNNIIYFGGNNTLHAVNSTNGNLIWRYIFKHGGTPESSGSIAIADGIVYFGAPTPKQVIALNATNGSWIWNYSNEATSPVVVYNNRVIFGGYSGDTGALMALNSTTGEHSWNRTTGMITTAPTITNDMVFYGTASDIIYRSNATTGVVIDSEDPFYETQGDVYYTPAIANGIIYVVSLFDGVAGFSNKVYALNVTSPANTGVGVAAEIWVVNITYNLTQSDVLYSPSVAHNRVYIPIKFAAGGNVLFALNATNGNYIWNNTIHATGQAADYIYPSSIVKDVLFFGSGDNHFYAVNATTGIQIWNYLGNGEFDSIYPPTIVNDTLLGEAVVYLGRGGGMHAFTNVFTSNTEVWTCSDWGTCSNNIQTRSCTQINATTLTSLPREEFCVALNISCDAITRTESQYCDDEWGSGADTTTPIATETISEITPETPVEIGIDNPDVDVTAVIIATTETVTGASVIFSSASSPSSSAIGKSGDSYSSFRVKTKKLNDTNIKNATIKFKVNKTWMQEKNRTKEDVRLYRNKDDTTKWDLLETKFLDEDEDYSYFSAYSPGFSTFVIFLGTYECTPGNLRCFEDNVQLCLGNSTWLVTETCPVRCNNGKCTATAPFSLVIYTMIIAGISIAILFTIYFTLKNIFKKKKK
ncbi:PQQ-binding-like beta-propeller repeat protein [Candidatus Pacearchaeota archaeon]|nr:PQQ-binding-like beta-propeller repeat protein [Candidatus Pacearchaeota archaeon]